MAGMLADIMTSTTTAMAVLNCRNETVTTAVGTKLRCKLNQIWCPICACLDFRQEEVLWEGVSMYLVISDLHA
jgi:hypothetical protein